MYEQLNARGAEILDATCPNVRRIHDLVQQAEERSRDARMSRVGQATRAVSFAESGDKEYVAGLHLGCVTNTQDTSGIGTMAAKCAGTEGFAPHLGLPDNFHKRNLGFSPKKIKKRVYKRRNF